MLNPYLNKLSFRNCASDERNENHQESSSNTTSKNLSSQSTEIGSGAVHPNSHGLQKHRANPATQKTRDRIAEGPKVLFPERRTDRIAADCAADEGDDEIYSVQARPRLNFGCRQ
jgi:hypothetical protein